MSELQFGLVQPFRNSDLLVGVMHGEFTYSSMFHKMLIESFVKKLFSSVHVEVLDTDTILCFELCVKPLVSILGLILGI